MDDPFQLFPAKRTPKRGGFLVYVFIYDNLKERNSIIWYILRGYREDLENSTQWYNIPAQKQ